MSLKLSERTVSAIEPPASGTITVWDTEIKGFGVRVFAPSALRPDGARSFFLNYRADGRERRFTIGAFPTWSAEAARKEAKEIRKRVDRGEDPTSEKRQRREAPTVKDLAERYRKEHLPTKAASSQVNDWAMITNQILPYRSRREGPTLGERRVADVHFGDIQALHKAISAAGTPVRANRVLAVASKMFTLSLKPKEGDTAPWRDAAQGNPCKGVERNQEEGHERFFSEAELAALCDALNAYGPTSAADCIRLTMLTGCRPGEAMLAKWEQFDSEPGLWVKPSAHTKQRKVHRVPLSPAALQLLERTRAARQKAGKGNASDYLFPGQKRNGPLKQIRACWDWTADRATILLWGASSEPRIAKVVTDLERGLGCPPTVAQCQAEAERRGVKLPAGLTDARAYDLRHTFASVGAAGGLSLQIIGRLLGHTQHRTTQRYSHLADDPLREAVAMIGGTIAGAGKAGGNVVRLRPDDGAA